MNAHDWSFYGDNIKYHGNNLIDQKKRLKQVVVYVD